MGSGQALPLGHDAYDLRKPRRFDLGWKEQARGVPVRAWAVRRPSPLVPSPRSTEPELARVRKAAQEVRGPPGV